MTAETGKTATKTRKAVAIVYDEKEAAAPTIAASGKGLLAEKIIATAQEAGIHIQEDPDLVELLAKVPLGQEIPVELYQTVAEVLAFVYRMNDRYSQESIAPKKSGQS